MSKANKRCRTNESAMLEEMALRLVEMEGRTSEYQSMAGVAARDLMVSRQKLEKTQTQAMNYQEAIVDIQQQNDAMFKELQVLKQDVEVAKSKVEALQQEKDLLLGEGLHDFMSRQKVCPVCDENKRLCVLMPCFHTFCQRCVIKWGQSNQNRLACPVCRSGVQGTHDFETGMSYELRNIKDPSQ